MTMSIRPSAGPSRAWEFPLVHRHTLSNGLRVAVAPMHRLPMVTVLALLDAGATRDAAGTEGAAFLTASALTEGTARLDGAALTEQFERLGASLDAGADWDSFMAHVAVTPDRLEPAMALLGEVLITPGFRARDVERLKEERLADLLQQGVEPRGLAAEQFREFLYVDGSRYRVSAGGSPASVRGLTPEIVRAFHARELSPERMTIVLAGDVTLERGVQLVERALGAWQGSGAEAAAAVVDDRTVGGGRRVRVVHKADAPQSELRVGHRGLPRVHPDFFDVVVMNALLGGLFSSRINLNLREKHAYTYGANSMFDWRRGAGPFVVSTAVKTEVTDAAVREILMEIDRMRNETVSADELSLATAYLDGVFPIRYETTTAVAQAIASATVYGLPDDYYTTYRAKVRGVTAESVRRAAEQHLHPDELLVLAVGDREAIRAPLEALAIGPLDVVVPTEEEA
jgi:zinc protease